jgi:branched-chain amino acid transport system permease protein
VYAVILATLGLSLVIEDATAYTVGVQSNISYYVVRYSLPPISIGNFTIPFSTTRIISLLCALFLGTALHFFLIKTETGRTIRAIMQDRELCLMLGINEKKISALSFAIGITLAGMGGLFLILITGFTAYVGQYYTVKALSMIVLGGMGSLLGSVIGSILIGITESLTAYYLGPLWMPAISIIVLFVILVIRPQGIVGQRG